MLRAEAAELREAKEKLECDLSSIQEQLTSQRQELSTSIEQCQSKVYTYMYMYVHVYIIYMYNVYIKYTCIHVHVCMHEVVYTPQLS